MINFVTKFFKSIGNLLHPHDPAPFTGFLMTEYKVPYETARWVRTENDLKYFLQSRDYM